jgi:drug/metabolite transporter (DMT)-like permease
LTNLNVRTPALTAAFLANLIYGLNYVVAKGIMPVYLQPRSIILLRVSGAALVFSILYFSRNNQQVKPAHMLRLAVAALFGVALNQIMFFEGLNLTSPINASIIMVGVPIIVLLLSSLFLNERLNMINISGVVAGFSGAAYLIYMSGNHGNNSSSLVGNLLILGNATSYSIYLVLVKPLFRYYEPLTIVSWVFLFGALYVLPVTLPIALKENWGDIPLNIWMSIAYVIVFTTIIAYFLNNFSLSHLSPAANSAFIYTQPLFASLVALFIGIDHLKTMHLLAALLIFAGVYLVSRRKTAP